MIQTLSFNDAKVSDCICSRCKHAFTRTLSLIGTDGRSFMRREAKIYNCVVQMLPVMITDDENYVKECTRFTPSSSD